MRDGRFWSSGPLHRFHTRPLDAIRSRRVFQHGASKESFEDSERRLDHHVRLAMADLQRKGAPSAVTLAMEEARNCLRFSDMIDDMAGESENQTSALWTDVSRLLCRGHCGGGRLPSSGRVGRRSHSSTAAGPGRPLAFVPPVPGQQKLTDTADSSKKIADESAR